jgi:transposase
MGSVYRTVAFKRRLLRLKGKLGSVAKACKQMRVSRDSYYRWKKDSRREGGLKPMSRLRPLLKNRVAPEVEEAVRGLSREHPGWGQARVAKELTRKGVQVSATGVRGVWLRHNLTTRRLRGFVPPVRPKRPAPRRVKVDPTVLAFRRVRAREASLYTSALRVFGFSKLRRPPVAGEIRERYQALAARFHPERMQRLNAAYETLRRRHGGGAS